MGPWALRPAARLHELDEVAEEVVAVVGTGAGLGMVLDGDDGELAVAEALYGPVVEVHVGQLELRALEEGGIHREAVVLRGDLDVARLQVLHGIVRAAVAEPELEGLTPAGQAQDLVAEADAEERDPRIHDPARGLHGVPARLGIAGTVGE